MENSLQELLDTANKEIGDVETAQSELSGSQGKLDKAKEEVAKIQTEVDTKAAAVGTETTEAVNALRALRDAADDNITEFQPKSS